MWQSWSDNDIYTKKMSNKNKQWTNTLPISLTTPHKGLWQPTIRCFSLLKQNNMIELVCEGIK